MLEKIISEAEETLKDKFNEFQDICDFNSEKVLKIR